MAIVIKKDGKTERFDGEKLERSLHYLGLDKYTAREIAWKVPERNGITTNEIRSIIRDELRKRDGDAAELYKTTRHLPARRAMDTLRGCALLTAETMGVLRLESGDAIRISHGGRSHTVKAKKTQIDKHEIRLHAEDLRRLGVREGTRVRIQKFG
jgi:hypothetical protein